MLLRHFCTTPCERHLPHYFCPHLTPAHCTYGHISPGTCLYILYIHSLQVKVVLPDGLPPLVVLGGQEAVGQPQEALFVLPLGCEHPQHQYDQNEDHQHSHQVRQNRRFQRSCSGVWRMRRQAYVLFSLPTCYFDLIKGQGISGTAPAESLLLACLLLFLAVRSS